MHRTLLPLLVLSLPLLGGEFINLGFDQPDLTGKLSPLAPGGPYIGSASQLLRGWFATANENPITEATYSLWRQSSGPTEITVSGWGPDSPFGNYLFLTSRNSTEGAPGPDLWLSQTGRIPTDAEGLWVIGGGTVEGFINGNSVGYIDVHSPTTIWNVKAYQGKEVVLQFHIRPGEANLLDIVGFTTVPEPSEYAMVCLGLGLLGFHAWSRTRQRALQPGGGFGSTQAPSSSSTPA